MVNNMLENLNTKQREAVETVSGPSVILAGAGSGKTRVLVAKVCHLVSSHDVHPGQILMITFTNKAAREMKERIERAMVGADAASIGFVGTFHSFCCYVLRRDGHHIGLENAFTIYDSDDQQAVIKKILKSRERTKLTPSYYSGRISEAKNNLISPEHYLEEYAYNKAADVADVYYQYQKELERNNAVDFDDLIGKTVDLFRKHPDILEKYQDRFRHIFVDEFQDTNYVQFILTGLLGKKHRNITIVGDFSQSIYAWRGADIRNLEKFEGEFVGASKIYLDQNYRSTQSILDYAYNVIQQNRTHPVLHLFTDNTKGEDVSVHELQNEEEESLFILSEIERIRRDEGRPYTDFAILYRMNAQSRALEEGLLHSGVPYALFGGVRFYERKEIKDILSYLRLIVHPDDSVATDRIQKLGKRRWAKFRDLFNMRREELLTLPVVDIIDTVTNATGYLDLYNRDVPEDFARLENIRELKSVAVSNPELVGFLENVSLVESEYSEGEKKQKDGVRLMTLHQAKGLEFPYVFIVGLEEGMLPHARALHDSLGVEEERRLFYVGITRAMQRLYLTHTRRRFLFGRRLESLKSRFIETEDDREMYYGDFY